MDTDTDFYPANPTHSPVFQESKVFRIDFDSKQVINENGQHPANQCKIRPVPTTEVNTNISASKVQALLTSHVGALT